MCGMFSARATSLLVVDLPTPAGPSMATIRGSRFTSAAPTCRAPRSHCGCFLSRLRPRRAPRLCRPGLFHRRQHFDFVVRQLAPDAWREFRIGDRADRHPLELGDRMADCLKHPADLLRATFAELHLQPTVPFVIAAPRGLDPSDLAR